jgi:hypothetical protein
MIYGYWLSFDGLQTDNWQPLANYVFFKEDIMLETFWILISIFERVLRSLLTIANYILRRQPQSVKYVRHDPDSYFPTTLRSGIEQCAGYLFF